MYSGEHEYNPEDDKPFDWETFPEKDHYLSRAADPNDNGDLHPDAGNQEVDCPPDLGQLRG